MSQLHGEQNYLFLWLCYDSYQLHVMQFNYTTGGIVERNVSGLF
jgi:hypothetical protein